MNRVQVSGLSVVSAVALLSWSFLAERQANFCSPLKMEMNRSMLVREIASSKALLAKPIPVVSSRVSLGEDRVPQTPAYLCRVSGRVTLAGQPYADAEMRVWVRSPRSEQTRVVRTDANGSYALSFAMDGQVNEPMDWEITGLSQDLRTVQSAGRKILTDDRLVAVSRDLAFN